jgi:hypothetical protein
MDAAARADRTGMFNCPHTGVWRVLEDKNTYIVQRQDFQHRRGRGMHAVG